MTDIDIIVTVHNERSYNHAIVLNKTGELLKSNKHSIKWNCIVTSSDKQSTVKVDHPYTLLSSIKKDYKHCSEQHGDAINEGISKSTAKYILVSDPDVLILKKDWDDVIVNEIKNNTIVFGTEYPTVGKFRGDGHFRNFPSLIFCAFSSIARNMNLDCRPKLGFDKKKKRFRQVIEKIDDFELSKIYCIPVGTVMGMDTGYQLPVIIKKNGYDAKVLKYHDVLNGGVLVKNDKHIKWCSKQIHNNVFFEEYHSDGELFVTHLGKGARKLDDESKKLENIWHEMANEYIIKKYGINIGV